MPSWSGLLPRQVSNSAQYCLATRNIPCLLLIITIRFNCGDKKILSNIKKSQNIMTKTIFLSHVTHNVFKRVDETVGLLQMSV